MIVEDILMVVVDFNQDGEAVESEYFRGCIETALDTIMLLVGEIPDAKSLVRDDMKEACLTAACTNSNDARPAVRRAVQKLMDRARNG